MLIIPRGAFLRTREDTLKNFKYADKQIIIVDTPLTENKMFGFLEKSSSEFNVLIITNSLQDGSIGGHLRKSQALMSTVMYYCTTDKSNVYPKPDGGVGINPNGLLCILDVSYSLRFNDVLDNRRNESITSYDETFSGMSLYYDNGVDICVPNPKYYTLDQQRVLEDDETPIMCGSENEIIYNFREIIDENTNIYYMCVDKSNIFEHMGTDLVSNVCRACSFIIQSAMLASLSCFTLKMDMKEGFNIVDMRLAHTISEHENRYNLSAVFEMAEHERINLLDCGYTDICIYCVYRHHKTYIKIMSSDSIRTDNEASVVKGMIDDVNL